MRKRLIFVCFTLPFIFDLGGAAICQPTTPNPMIAQLFDSVFHQYQHLLNKPLKPMHEEVLDFDQLLNNTFTNYDHNMIHPDAKLFLELFINSKYENDFCLFPFSAKPIFKNKFVIIDNYEIIFLYKGYISFSIDLTTSKIYIIHHRREITFFESPLHFLRAIHKAYQQNLFYVLNNNVLAINMNFDSETYFKFIEILLSECKSSEWEKEYFAMQKVVRVLYPSFSEKSVFEEIKKYSLNELIIRYEAEVIGKIEKSTNSSFINKPDQNFYTETKNSQYDFLVENIFMKKWLSWHNGYKANATKYPIGAVAVGYKLLSVSEIIASFDRELDYSYPIKKNRIPICHYNNEIYIVLDLNNGKIYNCSYIFFDRRNYTALFYDSLEHMFREWLYLYRSGLVCVSPQGNLLTNIGFDSGRMKKEGTVIYYYKIHRKCK